MSVRYLYAGTRALFIFYLVDGILLLSQRGGIGMGNPCRDVGTNKRL